MQPAGGRGAGNQPDRPLTERERNALEESYRQRQREEEEEEEEDEDEDEEEHGGDTEE